MTDKTIHYQKRGDGVFSLEFNRKSNKKLSYYLDKFNIDDYWIYKSSDKQKEVTYRDLLEFRYSKYTLYNKIKYDKEHIDLWIRYIIIIGGLKYLHKKLPPFLPEEKIEIRK